jgi:2-polyprenyl-3-methyl-5-hydroxy-6-metoxy-1,4-benzoquinol methylase
MATVADSADFDQIASVFADYGTSIRGFVRYKLTHRNLEPYLAKKGMHVLDVGAGNGPDAAWLASLGHRVTMLEPSAEQRDYAQRRFNFFLSERARSRITIVPEALEDFAADNAYDLVIIHGVACYQPQPETFIKKAAKHAKVGGIISVAEKGYYGAEVRAIQEQDFDTLQMLQAAQISLSHLGQEVRTFRPEELQAVLKQSRATVLEWSGIRVIVDNFRMEVAALSSADMDRIVEAEYSHGHNPSIRGQGQMLHFIARKR